MSLKAALKKPSGPTDQRRGKGTAAGVSRTFEAPILQLTDVVFASVSSGIFRRYRVHGAYGVEPEHHGERRNQELWRKVLIGSSRHETTSCVTCCSPKVSISTA